MTHAGGQKAVALALAVTAALALSAFAVVRGTWAVGGSDSSCYGLMAKAFASGHLQPLTSLTDAPWPNVPVTLAPGGFRPGATPAAPIPICAPGFSVVMTPFAWLLGVDGIFWVTPLAAAMLVLSAAAIAADLGGGLAGATAAILVAASPIVLFQSVQPMNDIVTAALWIAAFAVLARPALSGALVGVAVLVRPNLAPLAVVAGAGAMLHHRAGRSAWSSLAIMVAASIPGVLTMALLNRALYGAVLSTGYAPAASLFSTAHVVPNLSNYGRALFETQHVVPALALAAPLVLRGARRWQAVVLLVFAAGVAAIYALYEPFPEWWYLRFLIPAIVITLILASVVAAQLLSRLSMTGLMPIAAVLIGLWCLRQAGQRQVLQLQQLEGRYRTIARAVHDRLPDNAVLITEWESGSIRFHAGREVVLWESFDPAWLDRGVSWLRARGYQPYLLFERREERAFRERFQANSDTGRLDWPPRLDLDRQVRIYDPADRARFMAGESYATENLPLR